MIHAGSIWKISGDTGYTPAAATALFALPIRSRRRRYYYGCWLAFLWGG